MNKVFASATEALADVVKDGQIVAVGGFGLCGIPESLIVALRDSGAKKLTCVSNNAVSTAQDSGLLATRPIGKMISSYVGENKEFERQYLAGELELNSRRREHSLSACVRRRRHSSFLRVPDSEPSLRGQADTEVRRRLGRQEYVWIVQSARPIAGKAWKADKQGNLISRKTPRRTSIGRCHVRQGHVAEVEKRRKRCSRSRQRAYPVFRSAPRLNAKPEKRIENRT